MEFLSCSVRVESISFISCTCQGFDWGVREDSGYGIRYWRAYKNGISLEGDFDWQLITNSGEETTDAMCVNMRAIISYLG